MSSNHSPKKHPKSAAGTTIDGLSGLRDLRQQLRQAAATPAAVTNATVPETSSVGARPQAQNAAVPASAVGKPVDKPAGKHGAGREIRSPSVVSVQGVHLTSERRKTPALAGEAEIPFRNPPPVITYPEELPVSGRRDDIAEALQKHQVIIVCGETGSGKTTQLPKICLELGRGQKGLIGHTQPRRIAASSTAKRIAQELNSPLGEHVGFKVRFTDTLTKGASVKLMTDGILLAETQTDPLLRQYDTIIIDEAHERSLNIDFLLGYLKQLLPKRRDLKIIITSATIDAQRFANHFAQTKDGQVVPAP